MSYGAGNALNEAAQATARLSLSSAHNLHGKSDAMHKKEKKYKNLKKKKKKKENKKNTNVQMGIQVHHLNNPQTGARSCAPRPVAGRAVIA